jgi:hypothetical protein
VFSDLTLNESAAQGLKIYIPKSSVSLMLPPVAFLALWTIFGPAELDSLAAFLTSIALDVLVLIDGDGYLVSQPLAFSCTIAG